MRYWVEATRRKLAERFYRLLGATHALVNVPDLVGSVPRFEQHFFPYHLISPDQLTRQLTFNADGIPIRHVSDSRQYVNAVYPAYFGLVCLNAHAPDDTLSDLLRAEAMGQFLIEHSEETENALLWRFDTTLPKFFLSSPFVSGLAQGLIASLFIRLYLRTNAVHWLDHAGKCLRGMLYPVEQGGTFRQTPEGFPWIEEYPGSQPSFVLNGFLFSTISLLEFECFADPFSELSSQQCLHSILSTYRQYRHGRYLLYDRLHRQFCNPQYMGLHTLLFYHIYCLSGEPAFLFLAKDLYHHVDWSLYMRSFDQSPTSADLGWLQATFTS